MTNWNPSDTAPKDGTTVLAAFSGYPFVLPAVWCAPSDKWCCALPQVGLFGGDWDDWYFECEYEPHSNLKGWLPMPAFPTTPPNNPLKSITYKHHSSNY